MTSRAQHPAIDHVRKFLDECCVLSASDHVSIGAMHKAYVLWCEVRDVKHRRLDPVPFLAALEQDHGIVACTCRWQEDGVWHSAYALKGVRFKDERLSALRKDIERAGDYVDAYMALSGRVKETKEAAEAETVEAAEDERKRKSREYYLKNKDRLKARRNAQRRAKR
ncbi:hypothetical protein ACG33_08810 [Steroidobacter denitrificans]|uniref:Uncharacterized protein n=1 Tax=Steroidobacter denitrificans TaxID=465721 RepID=A0A127F9V0_STEDE|nr:primase-like DNA-binding domain-containing protein [Steroidobacter denitrificans]AMN47192.1 hypothetical protein ACG33_08810 [Steroidobacter denitrificans]